MEELELLQKGKLKGAELLKILRHVENCDHCFFSQPAQDPPEMAARLLRPDDDLSKEEKEGER